MLRELRLPGGGDLPIGKKFAIKDTSRVEQTESAVAVMIVNHIFDYASICLKEDRSKVKISLFAKSFIGGILNDNVRSGLNNFVRNMNDTDTKLLLDDIEKALAMRRR